MDDFQRQLELELEAVELGVKRYRQKVLESDLTDLAPGVRLMHMAIEPMAAAVKEFIETTSTGAFGKYRTFLRQLPPEVIAFIVANRIINALGSARPESFQNVAISITNRVLAQIDYNRFKAEAPGYLYTIEKDNRWASESHRRATILRAFDKLLGKSSMQSKEAFLLGQKLIELFIESTGLVAKVLVDQPNGKQIFRLIPMQETVDFLSKAHGECELLQPLHLPMVIPPKDWNSPVGGGFVSNSAAINLTLVKTRNYPELMKLRKKNLTRVYHALNTVQKTKWRINTRVLAALEDAWKVGGVAGLPQKDLPPMPPKPWGTGKPTQAELVAWKKQATTIYETHARERSKRIAVDLKLFMARRMKDEKALYFVWTMDWRGRMYPVQQFVNPQTDDSGRALLEFAEGKPLGKDGPFWLAVHGANCYGYDKTSFEERVKWAVEHDDQIRASAIDPMANVQFWGEADKPFQFLAFCFEWRGYRQYGHKWVSHLPVSLDGSCNGLQNFSAMLRDEIGGRATNLIPNQKPNDIYQEVADVLSVLVQKDAEAGVPEALPWVGKITRKVTKRGVMTTPYGVTRFGLKTQLRVEVEKINKDYLGIVEHPGKHYAYLAVRLHDAIGEVVVAARTAMDWLQEVAKICAEADKEIRWTTPVGFKPVQDYRKQKLLRINTIFGGVRVQYGLWQDTPKVDTRKMALGIAPNFVHSLDASHCMLTILKCREQGIESFSMIHDSYGTHAADVSRLAVVLRETFIEMYSRDILKAFRDEVAAQLPPDLASSLPALPPQGTLDLDVIRMSRYFFA